MDWFLYDRDLRLERAKKPKIKYELRTPDELERLENLRIGSK